MSPSTGPHAQLPNQTPQLARTRALRFGSEPDASAPSPDSGPGDKVGLSAGGRQARTRESRVIHLYRRFVESSFADNPRFKLNAWEKQELAKLMADASPEELARMCELWWPLAASHNKPRDSEQRDGF